MRSMTRRGVLALTLALAWAALAGPVAIAQDEAGAPGTEAPVPETAPEVPETAAVKRIKMYAENWRFIPNTIRVPVGTRLVIDFESRDASHSFVLKNYKIKVPLPEGTTARVEFVADRAGEFRWHCGRPCGDGCAKMTGTLIVE